jgi:hypothetical protein
MPGEPTHNSYKLGPGEQVTINAYKHGPICAAQSGNMRSSEGLTCALQKGIHTVHVGQPHMGLGAAASWGGQEWQQADNTHAHTGLQLQARHQRISQLSPWRCEISSTNSDKQHGVCAPARHLGKLLPLWRGQPLARRRPRPQRIALPQRAARMSGCGNRRIAALPQCPAPPSSSNGACQQQLLRPHRR